MPNIGHLRAVLHVATVALSGHFMSCEVLAAAEHVWVIYFSIQYRSVNLQSAYGHGGSGLRSDCTYTWYCNQINNGAVLHSG